MTRTILLLFTSALLALPAAHARKPKQPLPHPDFTQGDSIPKAAPHDWTLGATGARGWMYTNNMETTKARQICITEVTKGSPADGVLATGDVILGIGKEPFTSDPRPAFGKALTAAESDAGKGALQLLRWRGGDTTTVTVKLPVLGTYSATAPYDCPKSTQILKQGCEALARRVAAAEYRPNPISRSLNALALLASGDERYLPVLKKEAEWASNYEVERFSVWYYGYVITYLAEYVMATDDQSVMPGLQRLALASARGQSKVGSWGHKFADKNGRLVGYGMMNAPGVPLTISLVLAQKAGVNDPEVVEAIERSAKLLRFYIGKGAVPYGDHSPWMQSHEDNGKCGMAAVLFNLLKEEKGARFFSQMSLASHGAERDTGHTGNFWNMTWAMPGVNQSGPQATGAWMQEFGSWYYDLARGHNGLYRHLGPPQPNNDATASWDASGIYLLAYAMPLKKLVITGKVPAATPQLNATGAQAIIHDGYGWSQGDKYSHYDKLPVEELIERLSSWSPIVRERAAVALGRRKAAPIKPLIALLESSSLESRLGACQAITRIGPKAAAAVPTLRETLKADDLWLRVSAANALTGIGEAAKSTTPDLLKMVAREPSAEDPRGMEQRFLCFALFNGRSGFLAKSLDGVDRDLLFAAVRAGLKNQDGRVRHNLVKVYENLPVKELKTLLPEIHTAVVEPAPSGIMFANDIRIEGLRRLSEWHIEEGIDACIDYLSNQNHWQSEKRTPILLGFLQSYGAHAKRTIPDLERLAADFEAGKPHYFPAHLSKNKAKMVRDAIEQIKASNKHPKLISIR